MHSTRPTSILPRDPNRADACCCFAVRLRFASLRMTRGGSYRLRSAKARPTPLGVILERSEGSGRDCKDTSSVTLRVPPSPEGKGLLRLGHARGGFPSHSARKGGIWCPNAPLHPQRRVFFSSPQVTYRAFSTKANSAAPVSLPPKIKREQIG